MSCRGICERFRTSRGADQSRYKLGTNRKRCSKCEIWLTTEETRCPCCNCLLRTKPINCSSKEKKGMRIRVEA